MVSKSKDLISQGKEVTVSELEKEATNYSNFLQGLGEVLHACGFSSALHDYYEAQNIGKRAAATAYFKGVRDAAQNPGERVTVCIQNSQSTKIFITLKVEQQHIALKVHNDDRKNCDEPEKLKSFIPLVPAKTIKDILPQKVIQQNKVENKGFLDLAKDVKSQAIDTEGKAKKKGFLDKIFSK
jgi:hypothetical protein